MNKRIRLIFISMLFVLSLFYCDKVSAATCVASGNGSSAKCYTSDNSYDNKNWDIACNYTDHFGYMNICDTFSYTIYFSTERNEASIQFKDCSPDDGKDYYSIEQTASQFTIDDFSFNKDEKTYSCPKINFTAADNTADGEIGIRMDKEDKFKEEHGASNNDVPDDTTKNLNQGNDEEGNGPIGDGEVYTCQNLQETKTYGYIKDIFFLVQIIVPILLLALGSLDFLKAVAAQNDDAMKKAQKSFINRLIVSVAIFLVPVVLNVLFGFLTNAFEITTCGIGTENSTTNN